MVLLIIIPFLNGYFIGNIPNMFRQTHIFPIVLYVSPRVFVLCSAPHPSASRVRLWKLPAGPELQHQGKPCQVRERSMGKMRENGAGWAPPVMFVGL